MSNIPYQNDVEENFNYKRLFTGIQVNLHERQTRSQILYPDSMFFNTLHF